MSSAAKYAPTVALKIQTLPGTADSGIPPAAIAIKTDPVIGRYPDITPAEEPVEVSVHALGVMASARMNGIIRWRKTLDPRWQESRILILDSTFQNIESDKL